VLKRISDDPFALPATVRDNLSSQSVDATCIHEVEGTYVATENDGTTETSRLEGTFYWTDAYPADPSQLINSSNSYLPRFSLRDENGFNTSYSTNSLAIFTSSIGDQIDVVRNFSGTTSSHSVQATNAQGSADDTLEIPY
jgi:transposase-like protein